MYHVPPPAAAATSAIHPTGPPPDALPTVSAPTSSEEAAATSAIHPTGPPPDAAPTVSAPTSSEEAALLLEFTTSQKDALGAPPPLEFTTSQKDALEGLADDESIDALPPVTSAVFRVSPRAPPGWAAPPAEHATAFLPPSALPPSAANSNKRKREEPAELGTLLPAAPAAPRAPPIAAREVWWVEEGRNKGWKEYTPHDSDNLERKYARLGDTATAEPASGSAAPAAESDATHVVVQRGKFTVDVKAMQQLPPANSDVVSNNAGRVVWEFADRLGCCCLSPSACSAAPSPRRTSRSCR